MDDRTLNEWEGDMVRPLPEMRWRAGRLQQQWLVEVRRYSREHGPSINVRYEWRDVPEVPADAE